LPIFNETKGNITMQIVTERTSQRTSRIATNHDTQEMSRIYQNSSPQNSSPQNSSPQNLSWQNASQKHAEQPTAPIQRMEREARGVHGVDHVLNMAAPVSNYNTNTLGNVSFMRVEEERNAAERIVADDRLQVKLESLCEALRSRY
jgi:hypothetical protein